MFFLLKPLVFIPAPIQHFLWEIILNDFFKISLQNGELDFLENRFLQIEVEDIGFKWQFSVKHKRICVSSPKRPPQTVIRGKSSTFILLASQKQDADTLFFQRRLEIEGDIELGHQVKNVLDRIEIQEKLPPPVYFILKRFSGLFD